MRFAQNNYYIEKYVKCANCGLLIYGNGIHKPVSGGQALFCSDWCVQWKALRGASNGPIRLPIVHPPLDDRAPLPPALVRNSAPDLVTMNILDSCMVSICREMGILLMKTSYSTIFNEGLDFTCALADAKGDMIACAEFCPR